jgi:hypothetical protein
MPRKPHKYHFLYKTTCLLTGRFYYGMHSTSSLEDGYFGSGKVLHRSLKKYGKENHSFEIIQMFDSREDLVIGETLLITEDLISDPLCMNIAVGGESWGYNINKNRVFSDEHRRKLSEKNTNRPVSSSTRSILSNKLSGKPKADAHRLSIKESLSDPKIRESMKGPRQIVKCPHCGKEGGSNTMQRWHFDNCKLISTVELLRTH